MIWWITDYWYFDFCCYFKVSSQVIDLWDLYCYTNKRIIIIEIEWLNDFRNLFIFILRRKSQYLWIFFKKRNYLLLTKFWYKYISLLKFQQNYHLNWIYNFQQTPFMNVLYTCFSYSCYTYVSHKLKDISNLIYLVAIQFHYTIYRKCIWHLFNFMSRYEANQRQF